MPDTVPPGVLIEAEPTAKSRTFPLPAHSRVAPKPSIVIVENTIGVAVGPYGL